MRGGGPRPIVAMDQSVLVSEDFSAGDHPRPIFFCSSPSDIFLFCRRSSPSDSENILLPGKEGQLFVIIQNRKTGQIKLSVVDESKPMEEWQTVVAPPVELFSAEGCAFRPFNIEGKSFLICLDRPNEKLIMYKIRDPNEAWETTYEERLNEVDNPNSLPFSSTVKITIVYCPRSKKPYAIVHDRSADKRLWHPPALYAIEDATRAWRKVNLQLPMPQSQTKLWPTYMRVSTTEDKLELFVFVLDVEQKEL